MNTRLRVCLILEGAYPFITGGVSAWIQDIITGLPEIDFLLYTFSPAADQKLRYELPKNVVMHRDIVLGSGKADSARKRKPPSRRTVARLLRLHADMFQEKNADIFGILAAGGRGEGLDNSLLKDRRAWDLIVRMNSVKNPAYAFSDYFWAWQSAHRLIFDVLASDPPEADLYHAISTGFAGLAALMAKACTNKPFLLTEHGLYHKEREIEIRKADFIKGYQRDMWINIYNSLSRLCYRNADMITALFQENREKQLELGAAPDRSLVIPNGIDLERYSSVERKPRPGFHVGLVGRIVPIKDIKTFISVARIVADRIPEARFHAIGPTDEDPDYYAECLGLVRSLKLEGHFSFTGRQNVLDYYAFLDLMLLTSIREAQPLVILEGWAAGVPTASTIVGNVPEMLDYDERFLSPSKDPERLASCVFYAYEHPNEMKAINEANRQRVAKYYLKSDMIRRYRELYTTMAERPAWRA